MDLQKNNESLLKRVEIIEQKVAVLENLNHDELKDQLVSGEQLLPSESNIFSVLRQVEDTSNRTGILLNTIQTNVGTVNRGRGSENVPVAATAASANIPSVTISLSIVSDYQPLLNFLSSVYSFSRVVAIDQITISAGRGDDGAQLNVTFAIKAFWKEMPQNLGSVEAPIVELTAVEEKRLSDVKSPEVVESVPVPTVPTGRKNPFEAY